MSHRSTSSTPSGRTTWASRLTPIRESTTWPTFVRPRSGASPSAVLSSAGSSTGTCSIPGRWSVTPPSSPGFTPSRPSLARRPGPYPRTASTTTPLPTGGPDEHRTDCPHASAWPDRLQPAHRHPPGDRRLLLRLVAGPQDPLHWLRVRRRHRPERHRPAPWLSVLRGRLRGRAGLPQVPAGQDAGPGTFLPRERGRRHRPLLRAVHRPQGDWDAVPDRDRGLLLHRRPERDADPGRASAPLAAALRCRQLSDDRRPARRDDDGDHELGHPRPVRQLLRPADDRREANGLPADRVAHLLAADGCRNDPGQRRLLRRLPNRLDRLRAAQRPGEHGVRLIHLLLRPGGDLDDPSRGQPDRHDRDDASTRADLGTAADLLLGRAVDLR